ncbi:hypothetical protein ASPZODRAFT_62748 [Penicilliopsis zonata CBS 506.65]|uniref:DUF1993 domain-containing protein n=1 Tax=Penicilliopsis zonata CBS 506.65 TaxID=1073090 RepID=A0A1L9SM79_9EURO|nr:hypothetical protein ASPZODRAFT_62748 [Penicilliopsis zonata CBS 506.65]OJJ48154.1 hypothetical protein ASPZODRAFT_62748 [Penicilliopsis zonata CBS 506.65]
MSALYTYSVPVFINGLTMLSTILKTAEEYAEEKKFSTSVLAESRLIADMKPLSYQVQRASDTAKNTLVRVAGTEPVPMADTETTFEELQERIARTIEVLKSVDAAVFAGKEDKVIEMKLGPQQELTFKGEAYITTFALPNFFFHIQTAYAILRKEGVPLGKANYLGPFMASN